MNFCRIACRMAGMAEDLGFDVEYGEDQEATQTHTDLEEEDVERLTQQKTANFIFKSLAYAEPKQIVWQLFQVLRTSSKKLVLADLKSDMLRAFDTVGVEDILLFVKEKCSEQEEPTQRASVRDFLTGLRDACDWMSKISIDDESYWIGCKQAIDQIIGRLPNSSDTNYWNSCLTSISNGISQIPDPILN